MVRRTFLALTLAIVMASCAKQETSTSSTAAGTTGGAAASGNTIKIGVYGPFTGGSSPMGLSMRDGVRLASDEINARGGILGKKIELVERDDQATNERGAQVMQDLVSNQKVVAVLGPINTGVALASYKYPEQAHVPMLINVSAGAPVNELFKDYPDNYVFRIAASDNIQAQMIVGEALEKRGLKKVAFLCDDTNYGQNGCTKMTAALQERKGKPVYVGKFKLKDTDMTPQLQEAKAAGAEALIAYGIGPEDAQIANARIKLGWPVPMFGSWAMSMSNYIDNAGPNGDGTFCVQTFIQDDPRTEKQKSFLADYAREFKPDAGRIPSAMSAAQGYDAIYLLAAAIKQAGNTEGKAIKEALENLRTPIVGVSTTYTTPFSATDHIALKREAGRMGMVKDGKVVPASK